MTQSTRHIFATLILGFALAACQPPADQQAAVTSPPETAQPPTERGSPSPPASLSETSEPSPTVDLPETSTPPPAATLTETVSETFSPPALPPLPAPDIPGVLLWYYPLRSASLWRVGQDGEMQQVAGDISISVDFDLSPDGRQLLYDHNGEI